MLGIIFNHATLGFLSGPIPYQGYNIVLSTDAILEKLSFVLTFGKFFSIFSFLFGLNFGLQLKKSTAFQSDFIAKYARRLLFLLVLGIIHSLFFAADILKIYALASLVLFPASRLGNKALLVVSILLIVTGIPICKEIAHIFIPHPDGNVASTHAILMYEPGTTPLQQYVVKQTGDLGELVAMNIHAGFFDNFYFQLATGRFAVTLGLFLLGLYAGRKNIFDNSPENRKQAVAMLAWGSILLVVSSAVVYIFKNSSYSDYPSLRFVKGINHSIQQISLSAVYLFTTVCLFWNTAFKKFLNLLRFVGQSGLSNYLVQTIFGLLVFYGLGLGLMGKLGVTISIAISIAFFGVQILISYLWMKHFKYGPAEWVWRSFTYLKIQPLKRKRLTSE